MKNNLRVNASLKATRNASRSAADVFPPAASNAYTRGRRRRKRRRRRRRNEIHADTWIIIEFEQNSNGTKVEWGWNTFRTTRTRKSERNAGRQLPASRSHFATAIRRGARVLFSDRSTPPTPLPTPPPNSSLPPLFASLASAHLLLLIDDDAQVLELGDGLVDGRLRSRSGRRTGRVGVSGRGGGEGWVRRRPRRDARAPPQQTKAHGART